MVQSGALSIIVKMGATLDNRISGSLTSEQLAALKELVGQMRSQLPFLVELELEDIRSLFKLGGKSLEFVQTGLDAALALPECMPKHLDVAEFQRDYELFRQLDSLRLTLEPLYRQLNDTQLAVGSDAQEAALEVYASLQRAPKGSGAEAYLDKMKERFRLKK